MMNDKFGMIDKLLRKLDELADARGVNRCVTVIEIAQMIGALSKGLREEDNAHAEQVRQLEAQLQQAQAAAGETGGEIYHIDMGGDPDADGDAE